jgi:Ca2+-binding EF-hand superfamily protein
MNKICFAAMLAMVTVTSSVLAEEQVKPAAQEFPPRMVGGMGAEALKQFDKNGDGKLDDTERAAMMEARKAQMEKMRQAREKEFDKNGDGKLDDTERAAMMEVLKQRHPEAGQRMQELIKRFDKDGDGKLNDDERKAMMAERAKRMPLGGVIPPAGTTTNAAVK